MVLRVVIEPGEDGYFVVHCPNLRSCVTQGKTREEALRNIREAILLYLEPEPVREEEMVGCEVVDLTL
jgi:predicted RNase H-like HicB family nuclease